MFVCSLVCISNQVGKIAIVVDLDPSENSLSVPGALAADPMSQLAVTIEKYAGVGLPPSKSALLAMWYSSATLDNPNLFKSKVLAIDTKIDSRLKGDVDGRASGLIVNTNGNIQDVRTQKTNLRETTTKVSSQMSLSTLDFCFLCVYVGWISNVATHGECIPDYCDSDNGS